MDDLVTWLLEQIAEDERVARAATDGPWEWDGEAVDVVPSSRGVDFIARYRWVSMSDSETEGVLPADGEHIADWDPARVLAECEAKRKLVELHRRIWLTPGAPYFNDAHLTKDPMPICCSCAPETQFRRATSWPCRTLKALALPYVDRPGYREEWKP